jgi:catechol 2,3-dioxygenase-like lactoylglutathione lyase family enzyme
VAILPSALHHVGFVVRDLEAIAAGWAELFGVEEWHVSPLEATGATIRGAEAQITGRVAVGKAPWGDEFWLIEPGPGRSSYKDFQATHGHGIHHLAFCLDDDETATAVEAFAAEGVRVSQRYELPTARVTELDTRTLLGGYFIQLITGSLSEGAPLHLPERAAGEGPLPVPRGIQHFGVVVRDVVERVEAYERVFGITDWTVQNWRTEPGSLESPTFEGRPVEHEYFAAASPYDGPLGFEIVQPTLGPSDYKENFLQVVGEGIHHFNMVGLEDHAHWLRLEPWLESIGVRTCMSGLLSGGIAEFYYLNTRSRLGGIAIEAFGLDPTVDLSTVEAKGPYYSIGG